MPVLLWGERGGGRGRQRGYGASEADDSRQLPGVVRKLRYAFSSILNLSLPLLCCDYSFIEPLPLPVRSIRGVTQNGNFPVTTFNAIFLANFLCHTFLCNTIHYDTQFKARQPLFLAS